MPPDHSSVRTIPIEELRPGMFVERLDRSWLTTPFFRHRFVLRDEGEIEILKRHGIRRVVVDFSKSEEVEAQAPPAVARPGPDLPEPASPPPLRIHGPSPAAVPSRKDMKIARLVHAEAVSAVERMFAGTTTAARIDTPALRSMVGRIRDRLTEHRAAALAAVRLQQLQRYDRNLFAHVVDVSVLSMAVGIEQGLDPVRLEELALGALLHDIGEMRLPRNLFRKAGELLDYERTVMQQHPTLGLAMLGAGDVPAVVRHILVQHHERIDGSGYPCQLAGEALAPESQLVGLMDVYDAMVTSRGGRPAIPPPQAIRRLYQLGLAKQFSPVLVEQVIQCLGVYPIGSVVELNTGERAVVVAVNPSVSLKPSVKLITDPKGRLYAEPLLLDLSAPDEAGRAKTIRRDLDPAREACDVVPYLEGVA